jgi:hypothetical protein
VDFWVASRVTMPTERPLLHQLLDEAAVLGGQGHQFL